MKNSFPLRNGFCKPTGLQDDLLKATDPPECELLRIENGANHWREGAMYKSDHTLMFARTLAVTIASVLFLAHAGIARAAVINFRTIPMTVATDSLSFNVSGVSATVTGYHVEYDTSLDTTTIYGPFSTGNSFTSGSDNYPIFGRVTNSGTPQTGLILHADEELGQTDKDRPAGGAQPAFDNVTSRSSLPSMQFALFSFDTPVNVSQVIVDDASNFNRSIWVAGSSTAPNLALDFLSAFSGFSFVNSLDNDAGDGLLTHSFAMMEGVSYLAIGTPPNSNTIGDLGPVTGVDRNVKFYLEGLNVTPVPLPASIWLLGSGLLGLGGFFKRNKAA